jgi:membrane protein
MAENVFRRAWRILKETTSHWMNHDPFVHAGSLAFYTLFSLAPVVIVAVSIAGAVLGEEAARGQIFGTLTEFIGPASAKAVEDAVQKSRPSEAGVLPTIIGAIAIMIGATTVFAQMQLALNRIWGVAAKPDANSILLLIRKRILSLAIVLAIGFVFLVSLMLNVALRAAIHYVDGWIGAAPALLAGAEVVLSVFVIALLFALLYKAMPDVVVSWRDVRAGAIVATLLFVGGRYGIATYLAYTAPDSAFGAAGALVLLLMWVYYSSLILLYGAALSRARLVVAGKRIVPRKLAVRIREEIIEEPKPSPRQQEREEERAKADTR